MTPPCVQGLIRYLFSTRQIFQLMCFTGSLLVHILIWDLQMIIPNISLDVDTSPSQDDDEFLAYNYTEKPSFYNPWDGYLGHKNEFEPDVVLGALLVGFMVLQIPGGRLTEVYGVKCVFGFAVLVSSVLTLLVPISAKHWGTLFSNIIVHGLAQGVLYPALSACTAKWVPLDERAKFLSLAIHANWLGVGVAREVIMEMVPSWGWASAFYTYGIVAIIWCFAWACLVHDSPQCHPRISEKERRYLEEKLHTHESQNESTSFPWRAALSCPQFWVGAIAHMGSDWGYYTLNTVAAKVKFTLEDLDVLTLAYTFRFVVPVLLGILVDFLVSRNISLRRIRKTSVIITHWIPAAVLLIATASNAVSYSLLLATKFMLAATTTGFYQNHIDVAPNYAGTLTGISLTLSTIAGFLSIITARSIQGNEEEDNWTTAVYIAVAVYVVTSIPFVLWARSQEQPWNTGRGVPSKRETLPAEDNQDASRV